jgi:hypothetical protein
MVLTIIRPPSLKADIETVHNHDEIILDPIVLSTISIGGFGEFNVSFGPQESHVGDNSPRNLTIFT